jgi:hypothetical protein
MPNYFGQFEIVTQTKNFIVTCVDDAEARLRAQNVGAVCESDLKRLNDLFSTNFEAGNTSDHTIWVNCLKNLPSSGANGWNYGYERDQSSRILLQTAFIPPPPTPPPADPPAVTPPNYVAAVVAFPQFVFVAELAEILMDFTGYGWGRRNSMGEGLSIVLATLLHPTGYYDTAQGPRINSWLNGGGTNPVYPPRNAAFVNGTEDTDTNQFSYGCAILFINYLVYQLGHPLKDVIRAGGSTLAENYSRVTGQPASSAFGALNTLMQNHIGINTTTNNMRRDNIFPLFNPAQRSVQITAGNPIDKGGVTDAIATDFVVKPGITCVAEKFGFFHQQGDVEQPIYAVARGTANASFRWSIEGITVPVRGAWTFISINTPVTVRNPDDKTQTVGNAISIKYAIRDSWNGSVLYLETFNANGNVTLNVSAAAQEAALKDAEVSATDHASLDAVRWLPGEEIKKAWKRCNPFFAHVDTTIWGLTAQLSDLKNRPDPPSERVVVQIVETVHQLEAAVNLYAKAGNVTTAHVWKQISSGGGLRSADAPPAPVDLTLLEPPKDEQKPYKQKTADGPTRKASGKRKA